MTRLPVSSTSVGGRSNAICRVPKPSFATPMKGVTHMLHPHDEPPWTPQHTRALFRLFQTSVPPDFQSQILERVAQRQHTYGRRMRWRALLTWWPGCRAWVVGTLQPHRRWPGYVIAMAGCWGLVVGTSLAWWAIRTGPWAPRTPVLLVSRAVSPSRAPGVPTEEAPRGGDQHGGFGSIEPQEKAGHAAGLPEPSASASQMPTGQSEDRGTASQAGDGPERVLVSAPVQRLTAQKERQLPVHRHTQRSGRPRGAPGKPSRSHTRLGTHQQAPG
jgi:hypothetical protein